MTNKQWLLEQMQNMSDEELAEKIDFDAYIGCEHCAFKEACADRDCKVIYCSDCRMNWLKAEHKEPIKLSDAEKVILENIDENYKWIVREKDGTLTLYSEKPIKEDTCWEGYDACDFWAYDHLFQFIKWEDENPYNIEELLNENV